MRRKQHAKQMDPSQKDKCQMSKFLKPSLSGSTLGSFIKNGLVISRQPTGTILCQSIVQLKNDDSPSLPCAREEKAKRAKLREEAVKEIAWRCDSKSKDAPESNEHQQHPRRCLQILIFQRIVGLLLVARPSPGISSYGSSPLAPPDSSPRRTPRPANRLPRQTMEGVLQARCDSTQASLL
jgi:hypothetical protein